MRIRGLKLGAMHFRLPLQVGIFMHFVGPDGRVQLEPAGDADDFLAVGNAARSGDTRHTDAFSASEIVAGELSSTAGAVRLRWRSRLRRYIEILVGAGRWRLLAAIRADVDVLAEGDLDGFENIL